LGIPNKKWLEPVFNLDCSNKGIDLADIDLLLNELKGIGLGRPGLQSYLEKSGMKN